MTSRYWDDRETIECRIWRGLVVQERHDADIDALEYIRRAKADRY